jgi:hypothetical protein
MESRKEMIVATITSNTRRLLEGDHLMFDWEEAGLLFPSVTTGIVRTIKLNVIERMIGVVSTNDLVEIEFKLSKFLELNS